jgi:DNA modification methylase
MVGGFLNYSHCHRQGVLLDPFCGSGTMLLAGLDCGASKVIGIEKEAKYLRTAKKRVGAG